MLLVIPSITIKDGRSVGRLGYPSSAIDDKIYEKPEDRARLLRKENAKALHLIFEDDDAWNPATLELIERIRQAVDIPILVSLSTIPEDFSRVKQLIQSGIYRLFLPHEADDYFLSHCIADFSRQKIVVSIPIESVSREILNRLKNDGLIRICITLPEAETTLPLERLQEIAQMAVENEMRLSLLYGVYSYKELIKFAQLEPRFDSVILGSALEENSFPCQGIWREMEEKAYVAGGVEVNLWKNPLEHVPHL
jgi:phosphoribosylformimino-5-aminoimidazole carboxamide ribotide isomerase